MVRQVHRGWVPRVMDRAERVGGRVRGSVRPGRRRHRAHGPHADRAVPPARPGGLPQQFQEPVRGRRSLDGTGRGARVPREDRGRADGRRLTGRRRGAHGHRGSAPAGDRRERLPRRTVAARTGRRLRGARRHGGPRAAAHEGVPERAGGLRAHVRQERPDPIPASRTSRRPKVPKPRPRTTESPASYVGDVAATSARRRSHLEAFSIANATTSRPNRYRTPSIATATPSAP